MDEACADKYTEYLSIIKSEIKEITQDLRRKILWRSKSIGKILHQIIMIPRASNINLKICADNFLPMIAMVYKGNIIKNLIMDCQSYTKYRPNETTGGIFVSWRRKEELPTGGLTEKLSPFFHAKKQEVNAYGR